MRRSKFRLWHIKQKIMLKPNDDTFISTDGKIISSAYKFLNRKDVIVLEYTGLKDKNGKEIYEGDIVKVKYSDDTSLSNALYLNYIIEWDNLLGCFYGRQIPDEIYTGGRKDAEFWRKGEVIGNIYENGDTR